MNCYSRCDSPFGTILLAGDERGLSHLHLEDAPTSRTSPVTSGWQYRPDLFRQMETQLGEYFAGRRKIFTVRLCLQGSSFQQKVWQKLLQVPYGEVLSYRDLACKLGMANGARAVGSANGRNPIPVIIPCHRIIAADGGLAGYAFGEDVKRRLLLLEGVDRWEERTAAGY